MNFGKSSVFFCKRVAELDHILIANFLGVVRSSGRGKYLGLPYFIGRSKKDIFTFIWDRLSKKTKEWKD